MSIFEVGRLCVKLAGRDAGRTCVVVEETTPGFVVVDGDVRRKRVNIKHLEPLEQTIELKAKAARADVKKAFEKLGLPVWETKPKKVAARQKKHRVKKEKKETVKEAKVSKKKAKAEAKTEEAPLEA